AGLSNGVDQGFTPGNFSTLAFVGCTPGQAPPSSPNGNMNFSGLSLVPGFVAGDVVVTQVGTGTAALTGSATASFLDQFAPTGVANGSVPLPTAGTFSTAPSPFPSPPAPPIPPFNTPTSPPHL